MSKPMSLGESNQAGLACRQHKFASCGTCATCTRWRRIDLTIQYHVSEQHSHLQDATRQLAPNHPTRRNAMIRQDIHKAKATYADIREAVLYPLLPGLYTAPIEHLVPKTQCCRRDGDTYGRWSFGNVGSFERGSHLPTLSVC